MFFWPQCCTIYWSIIYFYNVLQYLPKVLKVDRTGCVIQYLLIRSEISIWIRQFRSVWSETLHTAWWYYCTKQTIWLYNQGYRAVSFSPDTPTIYFFICLTISFSTSIFLPAPLPPDPLSMLLITSLAPSILPVSSAPPPPLLFLLFLCFFLFYLLYPTPPPPSSLPLSLWFVPTGNVNILCQWSVHTTLSETWILGHTLFLY